jgi:hypothetical protein
MGEKALVESQISDSIELVRKLDEVAASPNFAVWYFFHDAEDWRLLIAGPKFDGLLKKSGSLAYHLVAEAMNKMPLSSISIADIKLVPSDSVLPKTVGIMIQTPANALMRAHFTDNFVNGVFLKEMFVLRSAQHQVSSI